MGYVLVHEEDWSAYGTDIDAVSNNNFAYPNAGAGRYWGPFDGYGDNLAGHGTTVGATLGPNGGPGVQDLTTSGGSVRLNVPMTCRDFKIDALYDFTGWTPSVGNLTQPLFGGAWYSPYGVGTDFESFLFIVQHTSLGGLIVSVNTTGSVGTSYSSTLPPGTVPATGNVQFSIEGRLGTITGTSGAFSTASDGFFRLYLNSVLILDTGAIPFSFNDATNPNANPGGSWTPHWNTVELGLHGKVGLWRVYASNDCLIGTLVDNSTSVDCCDTGTGPIAEPDDTASLPEWEPACDGGGLFPDANPVTNDEDWRDPSLRTPDVWLETRVRAYPTDDVTVQRVATKTMTDPTLIEGRALRGGYGDVERALSDWRGNSEASVFAANIEDSDGRWRAIADTIGTTAYAKAATSLYLLSEGGRKAGLTPRVIHRGFLAKAPTPQPGRKVRVETVDAVGSQWFSLNPEAPLQKFFWTREWLEAAGIVNTPKATLGQPAYVFIGEHSDKGAPDALGNSAEKGLRPVQDLGDIIVTESNVVDTVNTHIEHVPPPIWVGEPTVDGAGGPETYQYAFVAAFASGRTAISEIKSVSGAPAYGDLSSSNRVRMEWAPPAGWETYYDEQCIGVYLCGRRNATQTFLDIGRHALSGDGFPDWTPGGLGCGVYYDDQDRDVEKELPSVGDAVVVTSTPGDPTTITTSRVRGVFCSQLGWGAIHTLYGPSREDGAPSRRVVIDPDDPEIEIPATWVELGPSGDEVRLTVFYAEGTLLNLVRNGGVSFATNGCGWTDTGEVDGTPITELSEGYIAVLNELALKDGGRGFRKDGFGPLEAYPDGVHIVHTALIRAAQALTVDWIGGRGYQFHLALTEPTTLSQFHQWLNTTFTSYTGELDDGRLALWLMDPAVNVAASFHYQQYQQLPRALPAPIIAEDEVENRLRSHYDYDPDARAYRGDVETIEDADSQTLYGVRDAVKGQNGEAGFLEQRCTRDRTTARDAMARRLYWQKVAPVYQPFPTDYVGLEDTLGGVLRATHADGLGVSGYVNRPFFIVRKRISVNASNQRVTLTGRDLYRATVDIEASRMVAGPDDDGAEMDFTMIA